MLTIYKASAGSGKTFTLTLEYIKLLLGIKDHSNGRYYLNNPKYLKRVNHSLPVEAYRHRHILAITFTNKATEEMKTRIINELVAITQSTETNHKSQYITPLLNTFEGCDVALLNETAKRALRELLIDFDDFNVSTIDSFFQQVLRSLAYELDYPGNYEVVINSDPVTTQAVDMMLDDLNFNPDAKSSVQLRNVLKTFMQEQYKQGKAFNLFNRNSRIHDSIIRTVNTLFNEKYQLIADDFEEWRTSNPDAIKDFGTQLKTWQKELIDKNIADTERIINSIDTNFTEKEISKTFRKLVERFRGTTKDFLKYAGSASGQNTIANIYNGYPTGKMLNKCADNARNQEIAYSYANTLRTLVQRYALYSDAATLYDEISTYSFMRYTNSFIERIRTENNIVVLADTGELLHRVMKDCSELPFVYEKMGVNLHNFLIDEFQDTSQLQWQNLRELVFNGIAEGNDSLIIGDEKQAIYRFRNSDSSMLHSTVAEEVEERNQTLNPQYSDTNWRSSADIVNFNNMFFERMSQVLGIEGYETVTQKVAPSKTDLKGYIHFFNIPKEGIPDPLIDKPENPDDAEEVTTIDQLEVMVREIRRQLANGYRYNEIAILVDKNKQGVQVVEKLLSEKLPVITDEALMLNNCQTVRSIISIMQLVVNAKERNLDGAANAKSLYINEEHKYKGFAAEQAGKFEYEYIKNISAGMTNEQAAAEAINATFDDDAQGGTINDVAEIAQENPSTLYSLVEIILQKRFTPEQRKIDMPYIAAFQDIVATYATNYGNNIVAFLKWWESASKKLTVNSPDDVDAIKLMTIHKSKGLEFECVHIPFGSWNLVGNPDRQESIWIDTDEIAANPDVPDYVTDTLPPYARITLNRTTSSPLSMFVGHYAENMGARRTDGFNKTYVAYTRPRRELCVYYGEYESRGKGIGCDINPNFPELVNECGDIIIGEPTTPVRSDKADKTDNAKHPADWLSPDTIVEEYSTTLDGPGKRITNVEMLLDEDAGEIDDDPGQTEHKHLLEEAADRGERLHFVLSRISRLSDLDTAIRRARKMFAGNGDFSREEADIRKFFDAPATAPYVKRWFSDQARAINEMNIYDPAAPPTEKRVQRPDRIVWNKDGSIDIVDYKFAAKSSDHDTQVRRYMNLLQRIYPDKTINGFLWYADNHNTPAHVQPVSR